MHAVSRDLKKWDKIPRGPDLSSIQGYEPDDWRDPYVLYVTKKNQRYVMIPSPPENGRAPRSAGGCNPFTLPPRT